MRTRLSGSAADGHLASPRSLAGRRRKFYTGLTGDEHVLEELAGPPAGAAVDVASEPLLEPQPGAVEDLRIEVATVVHDDQRRARPAAATPGRATSTVAIPSQ